MKILAKILNWSIPVLIITGILLAALSYSMAEARYAPPPAVREMSKDIRAAQQFVRDYEQKILDAKAKAQVYRETICKTEKEACTKEYLDPLGAGTDLSVFIQPQPQS